MPTAKELNKRLSKAKTDRNQWRDLLEDAYDYIIPERNNFDRKEPGNEENFHIYDETAPLAIPRFASRMKRSLFPEEFVKFRPGSSMGDDDSANISDDLEEYREAFYSDFNQSNFATEITPALIDCGISTGVIQVDEESFTSDKLYKFTNIPLDEVAFEKAVDGELVNIWRPQIKVRGGDIQFKWPKAKIPQKLQNQINREPLDEVTLAIGQIRDEKTKEFDIYVLWEDHILLEEHFNKQRIIAFRMNAFPKETYGRGPGILVLPAIRDVNIIQELAIENAAIQVSGMYTARSDGVMNPYTLTIGPGYVIPVASNDSSNPTISRLPQAGDLSTASFVIEERQEVIRKAFFVDPLGDLSDPVRSATEQSIRMQEFLKDQGAGIARLRTELVEKVVLACVDIATGRGRLPAEVKVDGKQIKIVHDTQLTQAEKQEDFQNFMSFAQSQLAILPQEVFLALNKIEDWPEEMAKMLDIDPRMVRGRAEREQIGQALLSAVQQSGTQEEQVQSPA